MDILGNHGKRDAKLHFQYLKKLWQSVTAEMKVSTNFFRIILCLSESDKRGYERKSKCAYLGSHYVNCDDLVAALRSIVASNPVVGLSPTPSCEAFDGSED